MNAKTNNIKRGSNYAPLNYLKKKLEAFVILSLLSFYIFLMLVVLIENFAI